LLAALTVLVIFLESPSSPGISPLNFDLSLSASISKGIAAISADTRATSEAAYLSFDPKLLIGALLPTTVGCFIERTLPLAIDLFESSQLGDIRKPSEDDLSVQTRNNAWITIMCGRMPSNFLSFAFGSVAQAVLRRPFNSDLGALMSTPLGTVESTAITDLRQGSAVHTGWIPAKARVHCRASQS
jgi:hypothetical protein